MSTAVNEHPITDLPAWLEAESEPQHAPAEGHVSVSDRELRLATEASEITVPLSAVVDIRVGDVPDVLGPVPPGRVPVTLAFERDGELSVALVATEKPVAKKFTLRLVKAILDGKTLRIRHPARIGDASPDTSFERATLDLSADAMRFGTAQNAHIETDNVTAFERTHRRIDGVDKQVIAIEFVRDDTLYRSLLQPRDSQTAFILGRYLQFT